MKKKFFIQTGIFILLINAIVFLNVKYMFVWPVLGDAIGKKNKDYFPDTKRYIQSEYIMEQNSLNGLGFKSINKLSPEAVVSTCNAYLRNDDDPQFGLSSYPKAALYRIPFSTKYLYLRSRNGKDTKAKGVVIDERNGKIYSTFYLKY